MACRCICNRSTGRWSGPGSHLKRCLIAQERERADIRLARHDWTVRRQPFVRERAQRLVFIDETSVKSNMTHLHRRSAVGHRLFGVAPFGRWQTQAFIACRAADNLSTHPSPKAVDPSKAGGCWMLFLPAYSPDLNPIEMPFSKLKAHLRRVGAGTFDTLIRDLDDI